MNLLGGLHAKGVPMGGDAGTVRRAALTVALLAGGLVVLVSGFGALVGWMLAGALIAAWACVYGRVLCAGRPLDWPALRRAAGWGAASMPILALTARMGGATAWVLATAAGSGWIALVTPQGYLPAGLQQRWQHAWLGLRRLREL